MKLTAKFERRPRAAPASPTPGQHDGAPTPSPAARNLALAHHIDRLIDHGLIADYTAAARMLGVSQPRMTHLMGLLLLSPAIQEAILLHGLAPGDKELRAMARVADWDAQAALVRRGRAGTTHPGRPIDRPKPTPPHVAHEGTTP